MRYLALLGLAATAVAGDGTYCAGCQVLVGLFERLAMRYKTSVVNASAIFCADLSPKFADGQKLCATLMGTVADIIEVDYKLKLPPQHTCLHSLDLCKDYATCNLYSVWPPPPPSTVSVNPTAVPSEREQPRGSQTEPALWGLLTQKHDKESATIFREFVGFLSTMIGVQTDAAGAFLQRLQKPRGPIENLINHLPFDDLDGDRFSPWPTLRGSDWRGRDCDDKESDGAKVYPGRMETSFPANVDHNCNGIYGTDVDGQTFESKWCSTSGQLGIIAIGDSATARFRIPPDWLNALVMNNTTFTGGLYTAENEFDWPQCSSTTGHRNQSYCPTTTLNITSLYLQMVARNRCNHRDFQNLGVNGARTTDSAPPKGNVVAMKERNVTDQPALVMYAMIGNDVCSGHHDFDHMTSPAEFEASVVSTLEWLDARLQKGSHVVFGGLVDGRVLYNTMHAYQHPVGASYDDVYAMLNCVEVSPCWGWMNSNETVRNMTSAHAALLNQVYPKIIAEHNYSTFDMFYIDSYSLLNKVVADWVASGHLARDLIEPTDGFHPSQTANSLIAVSTWQNISEGFPQAIGKINPFNDQIVAKFGDQGGY